MVVWVATTFKTERTLDHWNDSCSSCQISEKIPCRDGFIVPGCLTLISYEIYFSPGWSSIETQCINLLRYLSHVLNSMAPLAYDDTMIDRKLRAPRGYCKSPKLFRATFEDIMRDKNWDSRKNGDRRPTTTPPTPWWWRRDDNTSR